MHEMNNWISVGNALPTRRDPDIMFTEKPDEVSCQVLLKTNTGKTYCGYYCDGGFIFNFYHRGNGDFWAGSTDMESVEVTHWAYID